MEINRTGPPNTHINNTAQTTQGSGARFKSPASSTGAPTGAASNTLSVTQADLADPGKLEETLQQCFGGLVDDSGRELGITSSPSQKQDLVQFMGNDPLMRGKLLSYLDQAVK
jgi:hypothetical protein